MQSNGGETNAQQQQQGATTMNLQFVNETEAVISESLGNDYGEYGIKRAVDSDSDSEDSKRLAYDAGSDSPSALKTGKKTKGRVKIKMEFIENKLRRYTTFSKRKTGIMKKAYELSTLTGTQVMLLVASETGHVYTFATKKLQPMITSESGKALIQTCLNSPDGVMVSPTHTGSSDQRMNPTGFEETELSCGMPEDEHEASPSKGEESKQGLAQPVSSALITSSTPPVIISPQSIMSTLPSGQPSQQQQQQQPSVQLQPPPAHMGIQSAPAHTQPPQAHTGPASTVTVASTSSRTVTMMSYMTSSQPVDTAQNNGAVKPTLSMQLPTGGFTIVPSNVQSATQLAISGQQTIMPSAQGQQSQQNTQQVAAPQLQPPPLLRIQTPTGQVIAMPGIGQIPVSNQTNTVTTTPTASTSQRQHLPSLQQPVAIVSGTSSSSAGPVVYQTPQGLLYAAPNSVGALPEGYVINLAATQGINVQQDGQQQGGGTQQYITIPVPVSLAAGSGPGQVIQPVLTHTVAGDTSRIEKGQK